MFTLNPEQQQAVNHGEGPLLIIAGPGSGKTRVLTQRVVRLLERAGAGGAASSIQPENILALTFTEKAALEMKRRVSRALPQLISQPHISTFHSFCYETLRQWHFERRLLDKVDVWIFLRRRMDLLGVEFYKKLAEPGAFLHDLNEFFSRCQDALVSPEDFEAYALDCEQRLISQHPALAPQAASASATAGVHGTAHPAARRTGHPAPPLNLDEQMAWEEILKKKELACVFRTSTRLIEEASYSSLGSLIRETVRLWDDQPAALERAQKQFKVVLVDEFQDTNYGQVELLRRLVLPPFHITAVGDDDQAIYRFRGASHGAFEMFSQAFPSHHVIYLHRNYRSTARILRVADAAIAPNSRFARKPVLTTENEEGNRIFLLTAADYGSEAAWIADEIQRLGLEGFRLEEIAVLYRAHSHRDLLVDVLRRRGIPFSIRGLSLLSTPVLRDVAAYLSVVHSARDNIGMTRIVAGPRWRFSAELAQQVRLRAGTQRCSISAVLEGAADLGSELAASGWSELEKLLRELRHFSRSAPVSAVINRLTDRLGFAFVPGDPRLTPLEAFRNFVKAWEENSATRRLPEFVEYLHYFAEAGGKLEAPEPEDLAPAVKLMTVHAAKGLEFPVVFVLSVAARRFPTAERKPVIQFPDELQPGPKPPGDIHLQEERRLFFVAITRAQKRLYISSVAKSGRQRSRFIDDLLRSPALAARDMEMIAVPSLDSTPEQSGKRPHDTSVSRAGNHTPSVERNPGHERKRGQSSARGTWQGNLFEPNPPPQGGDGSVIRAWAARPVPLENEEKVRLSATSAEDFLLCPLKYKFAHIMRIPPGPQAALTFGNLMHQSICHYFELSQQGSPSVEVMEEFYLSRWRSAGFEDDFQEDAYRQAGLEQLRGFVAAHRGRPIDPQKVRMEQPFSLDFGDLKLEGRIDQVNEMEGKSGAERELIDYKTGRTRSQKDADQSLQLSVYALAAREMYGDIPARLIFYNLTGNRSVSTIRTENNLRESLKELRAVAVEIRRGVFEATPGFHCRLCSYVSICPAHEQEE